jgi:hypothetical protein
MRQALFIRITSNLCVLLLACAGTVFSRSNGGSAGAWLKAPVGAEAAAMGGTNGADAGYLFSWGNPALLVKNRESRLTLGGSYKSLGRTEGLLACEFRVPPRVGMGISVLYRGNPVLDNLYDVDGSALENGSFSTLTLKVGLAYQIKRRLSLGGNVSVFYMNMPVDYSGTELINEQAVDMGGFDFGARFEATDKMSFGLIVKNLGAGITIDTKSDYALDVPLELVFPPVATAASRIIYSLCKKPFIWRCDLNGYLIDGKFKAIDHPYAMLNNGVEWQYSPKFYVRAGIKDLRIDGDIVGNTGRYGDTFTMAVSTGFFIDLSSVVKGLSLNYALSTDKIWAGVENVCDFRYVF